MPQNVSPIPNAGEPKPAQTPKPKAGGRYDEVVSRQRGHIIAFQRIRPRLESGSEVRYGLSVAERGRQRAGLLSALGQRLVAFFDQLDVEDFERAAHVFLQAAGDSRKNTPHTRCNAVRSALQVLYKSAELIRRAAKAHRSDILCDLQYKMDRYFAVLSADNFAVLGAHLSQMMKMEPNKDYADEDGLVQLHIVKTFMKTVTDAMAALVQAQRITATDAPAKAELDHAALAAAERELREIEAEIVASRRKQAENQEVGNAVSQEEKEGTAKVT